MKQKVLERLVNHLLAQVMSLDPVSLSSVFHQL